MEAKLRTPRTSASSWTRQNGPPGEAWFTFSLSPIRDEAGDVVAFLNVATETTERVLAAQAAQEARAAAEHAEHQLREVFAQAPAFMAVLRGPHHVFEFANEAYRQLVDNREIIGKAVVEALPELAAQGFVRLLDGVLSSGVPYVGRATPITLDRGRNRSGTRLSRFRLPASHRRARRASGHCRPWRRCHRRRAGAV